MEYKKDIQKQLDFLKSQGWDRKRIESEFSYTENYISQALSRGGNEKLLTNLNKLASRLESTKEMDIGKILLEVRSISEVVLSVVAEVLANQSGQSATVLKEQLQGLVDKRMEQY